MGELAEILERATSNDRFVVYAPERNDKEEEDKLERRKRAESGPVTTKLDLTQFTVFNRDTVLFRGRRGKWISVTATGEVFFSHEIGKNCADSAKFEVLLNRKGTILIVRENPQKGFPSRPSSAKKTRSKLVSCSAVKNALIKLGVKLPVRFYAEWDEELKAWVGKR